jgi:hypothetical protein
MSIKKNNKLLMCFFLTKIKKMSKKICAIKIQLLPLCRNQKQRVSGGAVFLQKDSGEREGKTN